VEKKEEKKSSPTKRYNGKAGVDSWTGLDRVRHFRPGFQSDICNCTLDLCALCAKDTERR